MQMTADMKTFQIIKCLIDAIYKFCIESVTWGERLLKVSTVAPRAINVGEKKALKAIFNFFLFRVYTQLTEIGSGGSFV